MQDSSNQCNMHDVVDGILLTFVVTRRVPLVEMELLTLPEHLSSPPVLVGLTVTDLEEIRPCAS